MTIVNTLQFQVLQRMDCWCSQHPTITPAVDVESQWMEYGTGSIPRVSMQFLSKCKQFQMELQLINSDSSLHSHCFTLGGEQTVKLWILILSRWKQGQGCARCFKSVPIVMQTVPDGTLTDLLPFLSGLPVPLCWEDKRLLSCGFWLSVNGPWSWGCYKCFTPLPNKIQTVPDGTVTHLLQFLSGFHLLSPWGENRSVAFTHLELFGIH